MPHALMTYIYPNSLATSVASATPSLNLHCPLRARTSPLPPTLPPLTLTPPLTPRGFTFAETFALLLHGSLCSSSGPNSDVRSLPFLRDFFGRDRAELTGF